MAATLLDLAGVDPRIYGSDDPRNKYMAAAMDRSFAAAAREEALDPRNCYAETRLPFHNCGWAPLTAFITPKWKYIRAPRPELYDWTADRGHLHDLATDRLEVIDEMLLRD